MHLLWLIGVCAGFFILSPGEATAAAVKLGVIDTERIMRESRPAKDARALILADLKAKNGQFQEKQAKVKALEEEVRQARGSSADPKARKLTDELAREIKELQRLKSDLEEEINKKNAELTRQILQEIAQIVQAFTKEEKYTLILETKSAVSVDESIDITDQIIKLYNKKTGK